MGVKPSVRQLELAALLDARALTEVHEAVGSIRTLQRLSIGRFGAGLKTGKFRELDRLRCQDLHWMKNPHGR